MRKGRGRPFFKIYFWSRDFNLIISITFSMEISIQSFFFVFLRLLLNGWRRRREVRGRLPTANDSAAIHPTMRSDILFNGMTSGDGVWSVISVGQPIQKRRQFVYQARVAAFSTDHVINRVDRLICISTSLQWIAMMDSFLIDPHFFLMRKKLLCRSLGAIYAVYCRVVYS